MKLGILDILQQAGFVTSPTTKFARHKDPQRYPVDELVRRDWLELYQQYQGHPVFRGVDRFVSFYARPGTRAAFYGVYNVRRERPARAGTVRPDCPWSKEWNKEAHYFYDLERDPSFDELRHRIVIDWGAGAHSWLQYARNKPVLSIEEPGRLLLPFEDYMEFSLTYHELVELFAHPEAHRDWRSHLRAVAGVYLILAESSGNQYVGSAYGAEGIWGRWQHYAKTGHGGNAMLRKLVRSDPDYPAKFRFSVLQILPKTMPAEEVIQKERLYKNKLGTKGTGLNLN